MDYESDLEELIQSDLHSEMNKILDQSDTNVAVCSNLIAENVQKNPLGDPSKTILASSKSIKTSIKAVDESQTVILPEQAKEEDIKLFSEENLSLPDAKIETPLTEFSGHFSLGTFPASTGDQPVSSSGQPTKSEQNDLSNLAWLTCVDVQQALQRNDNSLPGIEQIQPNSYQTELSSHTPLCRPMSDDVNSQVSGSSFCAGQVNNPQPNVSCTAEARPTPRYTPIQPNTVMEGHQRYLMQQRGAALHPLPPFGEHMGAHRYGPQGGFRPYPPPPYGTSGSAYMHEGYHHSGFQSQTQKVFPKPVYSYSCLIAMSLRASKSGCLPVSDIYNFMMENFPYFKTAPDGWKNSVRHNLSLNKCFEKVEKPNGSQRKGCLWALNPAKITKMEEEVQKWKRKDPDAIRKSMSNPEELDRELEEIRRSDEEAARRRMLSMTTHGLSMVTPPQGYHPYSRHSRPNPSHVGHMHPSGTSSLPTTPQHYHQHRAPYRHTMGPGHGMNASPSAYPAMAEDNNHKRHPRQLFNYPMEPRNYPLGSPDVSSTPVPSMKCGRVRDPNVASQMQNPSISSPYSSSSSSGNASFFGALADSVAASGHDLNDIDLDSSLADLSALQGTMWDDHGAVLPPQTMATDGPLYPFDDHMVHVPPPHPRVGSSSSMSALEQATTSDAAPESDVFEGAQRFGGDHSYLNGNNKTVMLH